MARSFVISEFSPHLSGSIYQTLFFLWKKIIWQKTKKDEDNVTTHSRHKNSGCPDAKTTKKQHFQVWFFVFKLGNCAISAKRGCPKSFKQSKNILFWVLWRVRYFSKKKKLRLKIACRVKTKQKNCCFSWEKKPDSKSWLPIVWWISKPPT